MNNPFPIRKTRAEGRDSYIGTNLPDAVNSYLNLYSIGTHESKAQILRQQMEEWVTTTAEKCPIKQLLKDIIRVAQRHWNMHKMECINKKHMIPEEIQTEYEKYKRDVFASLSPRLEREYVDIIVNGLKK